MIASLSLYVWIVLTLLSDCEFFDISNYLKDGVATTVTGILVNSDNASWAISASNHHNEIQTVWKSKYPQQYKTFCQAQELQEAAKSTQRMIWDFGAIFELCVRAVDAGGFINDHGKFHGTITLARTILFLRSLDPNSRIRAIKAETLKDRLIRVSIHPGTNARDSDFVEAQLISAAHKYFEFKAAVQETSVGVSSLVQASIYLQKDLQSSIVRARIRKRGTMTVLF